MQPSAESEIVLLPMPRQLRRAPGFSQAPVIERLDADAAPPQGYRLVIAPHLIELVGADDAGLFYARATLSQLSRQFSDRLPCLTIEDWPDFPARGVMLDISRDKVPTMSTLYALVDELAGWKINQLQLYTEHTFAYQNHREVWELASPMTADEIRALDAYCRERFVELVPNQNSFGHMERWLMHARYAPLAEAPQGHQTPWGAFRDGPYSLCPTDPRSIALLSELYDELLPNFSSRLFNVGCDETFDLGQGRSKAECAARGTERVYLDFLLKVHGLAHGHHRRMMFWGDIILHKPELIAELPRDAIALEWGYEADHPFEREGAMFKNAGIDFYVCPGTSSWCSIAGRTENALGNLKSAAVAGMSHGAKGYLITDWGDFGHLQYLPISYAAFAFGAAVSWCGDANRDVAIEAALNAHVFRDAASVMGRLALDLGNVYQKAGKLEGNRSVLFTLLVPTSSHKDATAGLTREGLESAQAAIAAAIAPLKNATMDRADGELLKDEFANAAAMLTLACRRGLTRLGDSSIHALDLADETMRITDAHRRLWLARNRPGGLIDSVKRMI